MHMLIFHKLRTTIHSLHLCSSFDHTLLISGRTVGKVHMVTSENLQDFVRTAAPDDLTGLLPWFCSTFTGREKAQQCYRMKQCCVLNN